MSDGMEWWQACVLGVVEGITEYLPVSSTGHLILAQRALGLPNDSASHAFAICIQSGAIAAVLGIFATRVRRIASGFFGRDRDGLRLGLLVGAAFVPAAIMGLLFEDTIDEHLFGLWPVVAAWFVGGVALLCIPRLRAGTALGGLALEQLTLRSAVLIGAFQCLALWPGTSRSLATIAGALFVGLSMSAAVEFSLLLGLVTLLAATGHKALGHGSEMLAQYGVLNLCLGFLVAAVSAAIAVKWMVGYLKSHGMALFGVYRVALAITVAIAILIEVLPAS
jgi:undecaprenyl-diphosphatase